MYAAVLAGCLLGTAPLELLLRVRVYRRWRRLSLALVPGAVVGVVWDVWAAHAGQWRFNPRFVLSPRLAGLPVEEVCFFVVVPICAVLTLEAVRRCRPGWRIGDEPSAGDQQRETAP